MGLCDLQASLKHFRCGFAVSVAGSQLKSSPNIHRGIFNDNLFDNGYQFTLQLDLRIVTSLGIVDLVVGNEDTCFCLFQEDVHALSIVLGVLEEE